MTTTRPLSNILSGVIGGLIVLVIGAVLIATNVIDTGDTKTVVRQVSTTQPTGDTSGSEGRTVRQIYEQEGRASRSSRPTASRVTPAPRSGCRSRAPRPAPAS